MPVHWFTGGRRTKEKCSLLYTSLPSWQEFINDEAIPKVRYTSTRTQRIGAAPHAILSTIGHWKTALGQSARIAILAMDREVYACGE